MNQSKGSALTYSFKTGDRIEYTDTAGAELIGKRGTVVSVVPAARTDKSSAALVTVKVDGTGEERCHFDWRMKLVEQPKRKFAVGDWVEVHGRFDQHDGIVGQVSEGYSWYSENMKNFFVVVTAKNVRYTFHEGQLKAAKAPKKFKVGDRVQTNGGFIYTKHKGKDLVITKVLGSLSAYDYTVGIVGSYRTADSADYCEGELEAYVAPTFNVGDYVEVVANPVHALSVHAGTKGWVVEPDYKDAQGWLHVSITGKDKKATYRYAATDLQAAKEPWTPTFKAGDWAKITSPAYSEYSGGVFEVNRGETEEGGIVRLNLISPNDPTYKWVGHFYTKALEKAEKPWAPKFKKGDWVEITEKVNPAWAGIGQIELESTKDLDTYLVKFDRVDRNKGGFSESDLIPAEAPKPFKIGDRVEVVEFGDKDASDYNKYKGEFGTVVVEQQQVGGFIRLELDSGKTPLFLPEELKHTTVQKPIFKVGDYVEVVNWGASWVGTKGEIISTSFILGETHYQIKDEFGRTSGWTYRTLKRAERPQPKPKPELPTEAGKVIHVSKYKGARVDLIAMCDGTDDFDPWFSPTEIDGDYWLSSSDIEEWTPAKVTPVL
jgi:ribosomal protein L21E